MEFALIAAPLVLMMCACVELGMVFLVQVTLDNAVQAASRGIRTGTTTSSNTSQSQFQTLICNDMGWLAGSCPTSLTLDVETYSTFGGIPLTSPVSGGVLVTKNFGYYVGTGSQIQVVSAYYTWPLFTPLLNPGLATLGGGNALLTSKAIFRNEPF